MTGIELGQWIAKGDLKGCTEALICSAQEQALRTNYTRFHIDHTAESPLCRMCGSKGETVAHVVSECGKLAQTEYKGRHDNVARYIHWQLCGKCGLERANSWCEQKPEWWRVKTSRYCGISQSSVNGKLRHEDQTLSLLIRRKERLS